MMLLPKDVGPFRLLERLGATDITEAYLGQALTGVGGEVVIRRVLPGVTRDPARLDAVKARVRDLIAVRHPFLVSVLDWVEDGDERYIVEDYVEGIDLAAVLDWCRRSGQPIPHNVFLNIATQICNALEALHGRPGKASGSDNVLHLGLRPQAVHLSADGKVVLGGYGLTRSPTTSVPAGGSAPAISVMDYLSPEQTQPDKKLSPASDIFSLGALIYELLTGQVLFRAESNLSTINRIRRAEVAETLNRVKDLVPGLEKVLTRALGLNSRHRYQRAFVLREDLRALMAGYSFNTIVEDTQVFLAPIIDASRRPPPPGVTLSPNVEADDARPEAAPPGPEVEPPDGSEDEDAAFDPGLRTDGPQLGGPAVAAPLLAMGSGLAAQLAQSMTGPTDRQETPAAPPPVPSIPSPPPVPTVSLAPPAEQLAERSVLADPQGLPGVEERTDVAIGMAAAAGSAMADPSSTQAYLRGEPGAATPLAPPPALPDPTRSGIDELQPARPIAAIPPTVPGIGGSSPSASAPPPPTLSLPPRPIAPAPAAPVVPVAPQIPAPPAAAGRSLADRAPPPAPSAPAPSAPAPSAPAAAAPSPSRPADDVDLDDEPPKRSPMLLPAVAGLVAVLIVGCGVLGYMFSQRDGGPEVVATGPAPAEAPTPEAEEAEPPVAEAEPSAPEAEPSAPGPTPEVAFPPPEEVPPDEPQAEPVAAARPPPAAEPPPLPAPTRTATTTSRTEDSRRSSSGTTAASTSRSSSSSSSRTADPPVADLDLSELAEEVPDISVEQYAASAARGKLTSSDIMALELVAITDADYTRARSLLVMHYRQKGDEDATKRYLDQIMLLPENQYNPIYLSDLARHHVNKKQYTTALEKADLAERHWGRLPPELVFSKKAEIYEAQASAWQGRFYASRTDLELLDQAVRHWQKFRDHVQGRSRPDLVQRADTELAKLEDIRKRLQ